MSIELELDNRIKGLVAILPDGTLRDMRMEVQETPTHIRFVGSIAAASVPSGVKQKKTTRVPAPQVFDIRFSLEEVRKVAFIVDRTAGVVEKANDSRTRRR